MDDLLSVSIVQANGTAELVLSGELDMASRSTLESALRALLAETDAETITLNLAGLTFCGGAGLHAFTALQREAIARGKKLVMTNVSGAVALLFDAVQFGRVVPIQMSGDADAHP